MVNSWDLFCRGKCGSYYHDSFTYFGKITFLKQHSLHEEVVFVSQISLPKNYVEKIPGICYMRSGNPIV